jgi:apolipoprotein N-acyltransferase
MPDLARKFVSETRANILVNLTNDAWYGKSIGPWQHLWLAQSRAIETRRSLLRVTNTGVTSLVNPKGELIKTLPMFTPAVMQTEVEILNSETYYARFGDWFASLPPDHRPAVHPPTCPACPRNASGSVIAPA